MKRIQVIECVSRVGEEVFLQGWVHTYRAMGKMTFIELRDVTGTVQVMMEQNTLDESSRSIFQTLRQEFVISLTGKVQARPKNQIKTEQKTGTVEILATHVEILNASKTPPFAIDQEDARTNEELRLKYRYLDLRHEHLKNNILKKHELIRFFREYLWKQKFTEIQTPILTKSTPEGARDYLVPSRQFPGKFFALPQSPQQYKQLLMVAGFERYFQIAPCFRDEDARADRAPGEFYQLDMEMSFVTREDVLNLVEAMMIDMVKTLFPEKRIQTIPFPRIPYDEALAKYNSDKPDIREDKNDKDLLAFCWVIDFPLFERGTLRNGFFTPEHHMFTTPRPEDLPLLDTDPASAKSWQYDLALNGGEVAGGSIRIHSPELQQKIFKLIGIDEKEQTKFSHMLEAFQYGAPPHGGIAPGIDRLLMKLLGETNIKEVVAFPKTDACRDPMMEAPSVVKPEQLEELHIQVTKK